MREVGLWISTQGTPEALGPVVVCVTGFVVHSTPWSDSNYETIISTGNVARGCLSMLEELPLKKISTEELKRLVHSEGSPFMLEMSYPLS